MSESLYAGLTSQTIDVFLGDSSSTTGGGLTGLVYNTASLTCYYRKGATGTPTAITLATQTVGGDWSSGGFVAVDGTNMPGVYRLDVPNAVIDTEGYATIYFRGAANLVPTAIRIDCRALPSDVKKWLTTAPLALSSQQVQAVVPTTQKVDVETIKTNPVVNDGTVTFPTTATLASTTNITAGTVTTVSGNVTGNVGGNVGGSVGSIATGGIAAASFAAGAIDAAAIAADAIGSSELAASAVTEIQSGLATAAALATAQTSIDDVPTNAELATALSAYATAANLATLAAKFTGITLMAEWLGLIATKKTGNTTARTELNATGAGSGTYSETTDSLEAIRDRGDAEWVTGSGGGGGGSGARTVTITVNDGTTVLENANVRMIQGAENYVVATNASGVAVFALDDATWNVAITKPGYTFTPTTIVVNGTETQTYSMTALTITPSNPSQVTGYLTIFGTDGEVEQGADIHLQQLQPVSGSGIGYDGAVRTEESGSDGVVEFTNLFPGARYTIWRGTDTANKKQFTLASNATDPTALSSFVGSP